MELYFTRDHEWIRVEGDTATIGITDYAQAQLGDVVFVDVPPAGTPLEKGREAATIESIKAASEIISPLTGVVIEPNARLETEPSLVNVSPEADGWFFRLVIVDTAELAGLLDAALSRADETPVAFTNSRSVVLAWDGAPRKW